jgi:hypothetical protein
MIKWYEVGGSTVGDGEEGEVWGYLCMYVLIKISNMGYVCL